MREEVVAKAEVISGAVESIVIAKAEDSVEVLPAASTALTVSA